MKKYNFILSLLIIISILCGCASANTAASDTAAEATVNAESSITAENQNTVHYNNRILTVSYIDTGQADSILITTPDNKNMLIDAGEGEGYSGAILSYLTANNIAELDSVVATHPHSDHINAMDNVINAIPVNHFYMPNALHTTRDFENMLDALNNVPDVIQAKAGMSFKIGSYVKCNILAPISDSYDNLNNYSVVIKLIYGDTAFLFTGDAEAQVESEILANGTDVSADVLKCGHHGSSTSTSEAYLNAVNPSYAIISCGKDNSYGHPHSETLQVLNSKGITVLRTDEMGTITLQSDGSTVSPVNTVTEALSQSESSATETTEIQEHAYIGNKNSKKYHTDDCRSLPKEANRVYFSSKTEAESNGFTPCGSCNP